MGCCGGASRWGTQFYLIMCKNFILMWRSRRALAMQVTAPVILIFMLWVIQQAVRDNNGDEAFVSSERQSEVSHVGAIPRCVVGLDEDSCYTFLYAPVGTSPDDPVETIVRNIRENNSPPIPAYEVRGFANESEIDAFMYDNLNVSQAAYIFNFYQDESNRTVLSYILQNNETNTRRYGKYIEFPSYVQMPMLIAVERELFRYATNNSDLVLDLNRVEFAHPEIEPDEIIATAGPIFIIAASIFNMVAAIYQIVIEKELGLRMNLNLMGLKDSVYWTTWFLAHMIFSTGTVFLIIITGVVCKFDIFLKNDFFTYFFLLYFFGVSVVTMGFLISTMIKKARQATLIGFLVFAVSFLFPFAVAFLYSDDASEGYTPFQYLIAFFSPVMLARGLADLAKESDEEADTGLSMSDIFDNSDNFPLIMVYGWLLLDAFLYLLVALYLDNVIPSAMGTSRPYYYFLTLSYWTGRPSDYHFEPSAEPNPDDLDEDVYNEEMKLRKGEIGDEAVIRITDLHKRYKATRRGGCWQCCKCLACRCCCKCFCGKRIPEFVSVDHVWYYVEQNQLFCLLGPNGAGKTTTINMLTGLVPPTHGQAFLCGYSTRSQMDSIRSLMGVCPQFDLLWNDLTGMEHLILFAGLKGIPTTQLHAEARKKLKEVELTRARNRCAGTYSGGMKRRLSVAVALIGDPKVVFLDEPTTGMDPVSRRQVWNIIERAKKGRVIVLTTHSMEEADILSDKIAIMANGQLRCMGTSLHLKNKFGTGYRITVGADVSREQQVIDYFTAGLPGCKLESEPVSGFMTFDVPRQLMPQLAPFFEEIESNKEELGILDLHLSLPSLEEVFLRIADESEKDAKRRLREQMGEDTSTSSSDDDSDQGDLWSDADDDDPDETNPSRKRAIRLRLSRQQSSK